MTAAMLPPARPEWTRAVCMQILAAHGVSPHHVAVVARRGYFRRTMGPTPGNDRGLYDDALAIVSPREFRTFNANVDPSVRLGGIASLLPGVYRYRPGIHGITKPAERRYPAFVQASGVHILRDGGVVERNAWRGINVHRGGFATTSSEGCLTVPPQQWDEFHALLTRLLTEYRQDSFALVLSEPTEETGR